MNLDGKRDTTSLPGLKIAPSKSIDMLLSDFKISSPSAAPAAEQSISTDISPSPVSQRQNKIPPVVPPRPNTHNRDATNSSSNEDLQIDKNKSKVAANDTSSMFFSQIYNNQTKKVPSISSVISNTETFVENPSSSFENPLLATRSASSTTKLGRLAGKLRTNFNQPKQEKKVEEEWNLDEKSEKECNNMSVSAATKRTCFSNQIYFLDYYFDLLTYINQRKQRLKKFNDDMEERNVSQIEREKEWKYYCGKERSYLRKRRTRMNITSFKIVTQVGQGGYGQVFLARKKDTDEICALKKMSKRLLHRLGEVQHILTERDILTRTDSPWLVKLLYAFQDSQSVYLAMEYVPGGDMRTLLNNSGVLKEEYARFYISEMIASIAELHQLGYIHRDLKPENFLIDKEGHLKLTDFGLSRGNPSAEVLESLKYRLKKVKDSSFIYRSTAERRNIYKSIRRDELRGFSLVGSPDYMAPEVLVNNNSGYGLAVDYWSVGCILFEMLCGYPPFTAPTNDEVWINVFHWKKVLERPCYEGDDEEFNLTDEGWNLIQCLIDDADSRHTSLSRISQHPFFRQPQQGEQQILDFTLLRDPNLGPTPPLIPQLKSEQDTTYFDNFDDPEDMAMYKDVKERQVALEDEVSKREGKLSKGGKDGKKSPDGSEYRAAFVGFTFKHRQAKKWML